MPTETIKIKTLPLLTHQLKGYLLPFFLKKFVIKKPNDPITSAFKNIDSVSKNKVLM